MGRESPRRCRGRRSRACPAYRSADIAQPKLLLTATIQLTGEGEATAKAASDRLVVMAGHVQEVSRLVSEMARGDEGRAAGLAPGEQGHRR